MGVFATTILVLMLSQSPSGTVAGKLLLGDGSPAIGVRVGAIAVGEPSDALLSIVLTDELGGYRMTLPPGRYYIQAGRAVGPTFYPGSTTPAEAGIVNVASGSEANVPNFTLRHPWEAKITGRVTGATSEELAGAQVQLYAPQGTSSSTLSVPVMGDGSFEFLRVIPGFAYMAAIQISTPKSMAVSAVVVDADDVSGVELRLFRTIEVHGEVVVEGDGVVPDGMQVDSGPTSDFSGDQNRIMADSWQRSTSGRRRNARLTGGESTFFLRFGEGDHKITVSRLPAGFSVKSIRYGSIDLTSEPLKLTGAQAEGKILITITRQ